MTEPQISPEALSAADREWSALDLALVLSRRLRLLVLAPLTVAVIAFGATYLMPLTFTAHAQILPPQQQGSAASALLGSLGGLAGMLGGGGGGGLGGLKNPADQWIGFMKSRTIADALIERFDLMKVYEADLHFLARDELEKRTRISSGKDGLIDIEVDDRDPKRAADIANAYIDELQKLSRTMALTEASQRRRFFERQLQEAKDNLTRAEQALKAGGVSASVLKTSPEAAVAELAQIKAQVAVSETRLAVLRGTLTDSAPEVQQALRELSSLRGLMTRTEARDPDNGKGDGAAYVARFRDFKYYETLFELMARQYEMARVDEARQGSELQVLDAAVVPEWKSGPKRGLIAVLALVGSFLLLAGWTVWRAWLDGQSREASSAETLSEIRVALRRALGRRA
ncbi:lipopolysaccharide biosynthesis protein [Ideonella sp. 4Y16]|uniref:Wzz/FepE/Etk N-terminal domain-containing protein n=1 Tax=Ideonella alba TaxID=2824118 RepID=UPI001B36D8F7|nr:Wzz/FepE/Etk N-terminal domain-containing protein [Ideonella alba]MBQ0941870.1 lipopolysaccharide biosynthesis protein [Ideonella alba]